MNHRVEIRYGDLTDSVVVSEAHLGDRSARLIGCDPYDVDSEMRDSIRFFSPNVAIVFYDSDIEILSVSPTEDPVRSPEPSF